MAAFSGAPEVAAQRCADVLVAALVDDDGACIRAALLRYGEDVADLDARGVRSIRAAAARLQAVADAATTQDAAELLNAVLSGFHPPRLTAHDGTAWHFHVDADDDTEWGDWFASSSALALAIVLTNIQRPPLGRCAAAGCANPYLTTSPGPRRRFCSQRCATRARVASHRRRAQQAGAPAR